MEFGAFVRLGPGIEGLVHVSELSNQRVRRVEQVVQEGQEVQVKILSVDRETQRMSLSIKAALAGEAVDEDGTDEVADEVPKSSRPRPENLKGGVDRPSGGGQFGLKW